MPARKIKCCGCGKEGEIEIIGLEPKVDSALLFKYLGHHEFNGNMFFLCPHCKCGVVVNPMEVLGPGIIKGLPLYVSVARMQFQNTGSKPASWRDGFKRSNRNLMFPDQPERLKGRMD